MPTESATSEDVKDIHRHFLVFMFKESHKIPKIANLKKCKNI